MPNANEFNISQFEDRNPKIKLLTQLFFSRNSIIFFSLLVVWQMYACFLLFYIQHYGTSKKQLEMKKSLYNLRDTERKTVLGSHGSSEKNHNYFGDSVPPKKLSLGG